MSNRGRVLVLLVMGALIGGCAQPRATPTPAATAAATAAATPIASHPAVPTPAATPMAAASADADPAPSAQALLVEARDLSFDPRTLEASAGSVTSITLHNAGRITHNVTIDELGLQLVAASGQTKTADLVDVPPGTYTFYCSVSGHRQAGMEGTLTIR